MCDGVFAKIYIFIANKKDKLNLYNDYNFVGFPNKKISEISEIFWIKAQVSNHGSHITYNPNTPYFLIYNYCINDTELREVLNFCDINEDKFKIIHNELMKHGALQYKMKHLIVVSAFCYYETLYYIMTNEINKYIVFDLIMYFWRGAPLGSLTYK